MSFILKLMRTESESPVQADNECTLFADITSVTFQHGEDGWATAHCYVREPVKTANVPGFCEIEKHVSFMATAYVMNENGKTVSTFTARNTGNDRQPRAALSVNPPS